MGMPDSKTGNWSGTGQLRGGKGNLVFYLRAAGARAAAYLCVAGATGHLFQFRLA